jgi:molybdopterin-binding protein
MARSTSPRPTVGAVRLGEAAELLGVSPDTVRRWIDSGRLTARRTKGGQRRIDAESLARLAAEGTGTRPAARGSARNRFLGIVTRVVRDRVAAHVELQAGVHRFVSMISREAADDLGLAPGVVAVAVVKATNVMVELPSERRKSGA